MTTYKGITYINLFGETIHVNVDGEDVQTFDVDGPELAVTYNWEDSRDGLSRDISWNYSGKRPERQKDVCYIVPRDVALLEERGDFVYPDGKHRDGPDGPRYAWLVRLG